MKSHTNVFLNTLTQAKISSSIYGTLLIISFASVLITLNLHFVLLFVKILKCFKDCKMNPKFQQLNKELTSQD